MPQLINTKKSQPPFGLAAPVGQMGANGVSAGNSLTLSTGNMTATAYPTYSTLSTSIKKPVTHNPNWKKIPTNHSQHFETEVYESPVNGQQAWVASLSVCSGPAMHHWLLFCKFHPEVDFIPCALAEADSSILTRSNILFADEKAFITFEKWFESYLKLFGDCRETIYSYTLPPPPRRIEQCVTIQRRDVENELDLAFWLMNNCESEFYYLAGRLFFTNDGDATLYKLAFKDDEK